MFPDQKLADEFDGLAAYATKKMKRTRIWRRVWIGYMVLSYTIAAYFACTALMSIYRATIGGDSGWHWIIAGAQVLVAIVWATLNPKSARRGIARHDATLERLREDRGFYRLQADLYREEEADDADREER
ncbi:hypothetical protein HOT31_gp112 [Microbacterium phage Hendrix]|uniref:Uncharacterized protein n=1 Tax=Microbacterium phage Hendrix TaxID=2182341 RepID=A0A2U8UUN4_9CAUD|nr:hypothetical protein HOT31_gp112 [Microbacterium phage Hendrix]AWN07783.1 hypothetical protein PBI_HENDRIX_112 [Microbacterium phage Hendrix]